VLTNVIPAKISEKFEFYLYSVDCTDQSDKMLDSRSRRLELFFIGLWDNLLCDMPQNEKEALKRMVFFSGSFFYSARKIPGLEKEKLPVTLCDGTATRGDTMRCVGFQSFTAPTKLQPATKTAQPAGANQVQFDGLRCKNCTRTFPNDGELLQHCRDTGHSPIFGEDEDGADAPVPSTDENFVAFVNLAMQRAMGQCLTKWGREYVDRSAPVEATNHHGKKLGVCIFQAIALSFGIVRAGGGPPSLALTCDLRAKVIRTTSVLDAIYLPPSRDPKPLTVQQQQQAERALTPQDKKRIEHKLIGEVVIYKNDKTCYMVTGLDFNNSANSLPVASKGISHTEYFAQKGIKLEFPDAKPMIVVEGRRKQSIYLPPELVAANELDPDVKQMLPQIASFKPDTRNAAIEKVKAFLKPGEQKKSGGSLLPAIGIFLEDKRIVTQARVLPAPMMVAAGVPIPKDKAEFWVPVLGKANFKVEPKNAVQFNVVVFHHPKLGRGAQDVYNQIQRQVNSLKTYYRFSDKPYALVPTGDGQAHWGAVEKYFGSGKVPANLFVLDFVKPAHTALDPAYPVVKQMLTKSGMLSQFVNFKTCAHDMVHDDRGMKKSTMILSGVARQILQKAGVSRLLL